MENQIHFYTNECVNEWADILNTMDKPCKKPVCFFSWKPDAIYHTHYYNGNLIWRTVSRRVDEVIPSDHPRRQGSRVIRWYDLIHET